ncbi:MAG: response regulator, partial [Spirochaetales bacterium]|nr:response regulator [Spirochaetales bacterium]
MNRRDKKYSLRGTVIMIIAACFIVLLILFSSIFFPAMFGMIHKAEDIVLENLRTIIEENLAERKASIRHITLAYADWDQSVAFVTGSNSAYVEDNWPSGIIAHEYNLNLVVFADSGQRIVYKELFDYLNETMMPEPPGIAALISRLYEKVLQKYDKDSKDFNAMVAEEILFLGDTPYYICAAPVAVYTESDAPFGVFVTGVLLTDKYLSSIIHFPRTDFTLLNTLNSSLKAPGTTDRSSSATISINIPVENPGEGTLILRATRERTNFRNGSRVIILTSIGLCAAIGGIFIVLSFFFHRGVLRPILLLNREVAAIKGSEPLKMRGYGRQIEIHSLAAAINTMLQHLTDREEAESRLLRRIEQQELMRELSQIFASGSNTQTNIKNSLAMVGLFLKADRVIIAYINQEKQRIEYPYVWRGGDSSCLKIEPIPFDPEDLLYKELSEGPRPCIAIDDTSDTPYRLFRDDGMVKAFVSAPIRVAPDTLWGILTIDVFGEPRRWSESNIQLVGLIQNELSNDIAKSIIKDNLIRTSSIVEGTPRFVMFMNSGGGIEYVNPAIIRDTGYSEEEYKDRGLALLVGPEDLARINAEYLPQVLKEGKSNFTAASIRKSGEKRVLSVTAFSLTLENGEIAIALTANDITDLQALQRQLVAAKEQAEYYNKVKSNFISRMSHEMRTPMNAIIGMAGIGQAAGEEGRKNYCLGKIDNSARDLLDIINNMLDMVKFENQTYEVSLREFDLPAMLRALSDMFTVRASEKKQRFSMEMAQDIPRRILCDENALKHALVNILGNAMKFTPEGGLIRLSAGVGKKEGDTAVLCFAISDTGIGIQKEHQARLWEAFEQEDSGITRRYGGVGLGLAISKKIIELLCGDIQVESEPGKGSVFTFTIQAGIPASVSAVEPAAVVDAPFAGRRFLLTDDIELNREILIAMLDGTGALIDCAVDGKDALEKFSENSRGYDLLLMDLHMPGMDGFEATRRIRASGLGKALTLPIIAVTADTGGEVITQCIQAGMNAHIGKPVDFDELMKT